MINHVSPRFRASYKALPAEIQRLADKDYRLFKQNSNHPSLHFKKVGRYWSVRVGAGHRALAVAADDGLLWVWIGTHTDYDRLIRG